MLQIHIFYSGNVQGVGFRFTVRRCAVEEGVTGWVRNLTNEVYKAFVADVTQFQSTIINFLGEPRTYGLSVALLEGEESKVESVLRKIEAYFESHIQNREREDCSSDQKFEKFEIVH